MSVKVTCHYIKDNCDLCDFEDYCEHADCFCACHEQVPDENDPTGLSCIYYRSSQAVFSGTFEEVEYDENEGLTVDGTFYPDENIKYLALDFGSGNKVFKGQKRKIKK